jgi:peptide/nickel transport system substrate-binding protein
MEYDVLCSAEFLDHIASAQHFAESLTQFGIKVTMRAMPFAQASVEQQGGNFELAYDFWGTGNPFPVFSYVSTLLSKVPPLSGGPYTSFDLRQRTDVAGEVDFRELIVASGEGLDTNIHKANITRAALAYNEVLPNLPMFERYSNGPALEGARVTGWPPDGDPIYENTLHDDAYVVILIFDGRLGPPHS